MTAIKHALLGLLALLTGVLLYPAGIQVWGFLLKTIAWPESRWGEQGSRLIGQALQPFGYLIMIGLIGSILAFCSARLATRYSFIVSLGALCYFGLLALTSDASVLDLARYVALEGLFFVVLLPALTLLIVRAGWLDRRPKTAAS